MSETKCIELPHEVLISLAKMSKMKNAEYNHAYTRHGKIMKAFFPDGITLKTEEDFQLWNMIEHTIGKLNRIASSLQVREGLHVDSASDISIYMAMAVAEEGKKKNKA